MAKTKTGQRYKVKKSQEQKDYLISGKAGISALCSFYLHFLSEPQSQETPAQRKLALHRKICPVSVVILRWSYGLITWQGYQDAGGLSRYKEVGGDAGQFVAPTPHLL